MNDEEKQLEEIKACLDKSPRLPPSPEQVRWLLAALAEKGREMARLTKMIVQLTGKDSTF